MTAENFNEVMNLLLNRTSFQIFTIELNGGKRFEIDHATATAVREGAAFFWAPGGIPVWFDHDSVNQIIGARSNTEV